MTPTLPDIRKRLEALEEQLVNRANEHAEDISWLHKRIDKLVSRVYALEKKQPAKRGRK